MSDFEIPSINLQPPLLQSEDKPMVECPKCGEPLVKGGKGKYFCENEQCSVIFVRYPSFPSKTKLVASSLAKPDKTFRIKTHADIDLIKA
jgi:hypothetical protein